MKTGQILMNRLGGNYKGDGPGILRKIPDEALDELRKIFEVTGGIADMKRLNSIQGKKLKK